MEMFIKIEKMYKIYKIVLISSIIGIIGGLSSVILSLIIFNFPYQKNIFMLPIIFFIVGLIIDYNKKLKGSGIDIFLKSLYENLPLSWIEGILKVILSGIIIGVGGSAGKEGPCVFSSGAFAYSFIKIKKMNIKNKILASLAAISGGLAGAFSSPLGAAVFACELIESENFKYFDLLPCILASISGYTIYYIITKKNLKYYISGLNIYYNYFPPDLIFFILAAFICSYIALLYIKIYRYVSNYFDKLNCPWSIKLLIGGLVVSGIGYFYPQTLGLGLDLLRDIFIDIYNYGVIFFLLLLISKILTTTFTVGSGAPGGLVFPSLCIGAIAGALSYSLISLIYPISPIPFIILGIATVVSATTNTPLGTAIICIELFGHDFIIPATIGAIIGFKMTKSETIFKYIRF